MGGVPRTGGSRILNFSISQSKTQIFSTPSSSFDRSAKNPHASKNGSSVAKFWNYEPCLTTPECPGFRHHPHERPEFLGPFLLLFLWFIDFSAAPKHCRNSFTAFTGMRAGRWADHSTRFGHVHALIIDWAPRLLPVQCPEFLTDCVVAFAQHGLPEQRVKLRSGGLQQELPLPSMMCWYGYCKVLPPWIVWSGHCLFLMGSWFLSRTHHGALQPDDAPTLIESCQSVVYLTTSDAYASRRWLLGWSASQWSAHALFINLQPWCLREHCAWCVSLCTYA